MTYRLRCYRRSVAKHSGPLWLVKLRANWHIRHCPEGAMPWAWPVRWYRVDLRDHGLPLSWSASHRKLWRLHLPGEWLDHSIERIEGERHG